MSSRSAISSAAATAAPEEMPPGMPSTRASLRAMSKAVSLPIVSTSSIRARSRLPGTKPAPMPWILWGPASPPERIGLSSGSTATIFTCGARCFRTRPTPVRVPPVPTPATKTSRWPSVSAQISSAVVASWIAGLAVFSNCWGITASPISAASSSARSMAPRMPRAGSVSSSRAPSRASILRRSIDMLSGMHRISL